jgi:hypothetical protein
MSIQLRLTHEEGVRLRQQTAQKLERTAAGFVQSAGDWKFDKHQDANGHTTEECPQDLDPRRVGNDGKKLPLGTYTLHLTYNMRNLVVERKGKIAPYNFKNPALRNQMRVRYQELKATGRKTKDGKEIHEWKDAPGAPQYIPPNTFGGAFVGDNQRAILEEMPT